MKNLRIGGASLVLLCLSTACTIVPERRSSVAPLVMADAAEPRTPRGSAAIADGIGESYTMAKLGVFMPDGDIGGLDDGVAGELIFGRELLPFLAVEGSLGYLSADGRFGPTTMDLWAIPLFVHLRGSLPVLFFEPYAGVGIGGLYADYDAGSAFSSTDFVAAWDAFLGLEFGVGGLAIGAEYRYLQTEETKDDFAIEGSTASLFVSLPF